MAEDERHQQEIIISHEILSADIDCSACPYVLYGQRRSLGRQLPDGTDIPAWFNDTSRIDIDTLGRKYVITSYGVKNDSTLLQTEAIQRVIDLAAAEGGGVIVVPEGTFLSGSLFSDKAPICIFAVAE